MKENLGLEHVRRGLLSFQGKIETISPDIPGKVTVSSSFDPTFLPIPPQSLAFPPAQKIYF